MIVFAVAIVGAAGAGAAAADTDAAPRATLTDFACHQARQPFMRAISTTAVMRPITGTERMGLRFELLSKTPGSGRFVEADGAGLGTWIYPTDPPTLGQRPGDVWRLQKPVTNLPAAIYRFRVSFRWFGAGGTVLATAVKLSQRCDQR
jgi:hypothetical protein